ncbi:MAG TPA: TylF/MycF/NovP-related O-methyltransferase [Terracidiphilus sp.]|nr:TylF/MycF/NovP-related O-methyltransferase [Terracidiphilus sp.]
MEENTNSKKTTQRADAMAMYLDMMKLSLTDSIYLNDPLAMYAFCRPRTSTTARWKRYGVVLLEKLLSQYKIRLVKPYYSFDGIDNSSPSARDKLADIRRNGLDWPLRAHTMIGMKRLDNLQFCVETAINDGIQGDLIETGVWRGGACIFMRSILKAYGDTTRTVWVADSFVGLPPPNVEIYHADAGDIHHTYVNYLGVSRQVVEENFRSYNLLDGQVRFLEGWFKDTLPNAPIDRLAVLRLDGDMYESTIQALEALYYKLSCGGFVIIDDYFLGPCRQAVTDFRLRNRIDDAIIDIDGMGVFWRKS